MPDPSPIQSPPSSAAVAGSPRILMVDNYDSFTWNLVHYLGEAGAEVEVVRNDALTVEQALARGDAGIVVSPGPCAPAQAGIIVPLIRRAAETGVPVMGVCLGHQAIGEAFGGRVVRADRIVHGKVDDVGHDAVYGGTGHELVVNRGDGSSQLTLSFRGQVYVFDAVTPDKVRACDLGFLSILMEC